MNNKHYAVWAVAGLLIVFGALLIWYMATHPAPHALAPGDNGTATSTTPFVDQPQHIRDKGPYYEIDAVYPGTTPLAASAGAEADAEAVALMKSFEENTITAFKENSDLGNITPDRIEMEGLSQDRFYAMEIEYTLIEGPKTITYSFPIYQDTLGAHSNTYYRTFTFDRATGENLHIEDLFVPGAAYLDRLSERTRALLPGIMAAMAGITPAEVDKEYIESGTLPIADAFQNFALENGTLRMIFPPYQVGPYVYGTIEVPIPLSSLGDILKPEYKP